jgi:hypothetical protein
MLLGYGVEKRPGDCPWCGFSRVGAPAHALFSLTSLLEKALREKERKTYTKREINVILRRI